MGKFEIIIKSTLSGIGIGLALLGALSFIIPIDVEKVCIPFVTTFLLTCFVVSIYHTLIKSL